MAESDVLHGSKPPSFDDAAYIGGTRFRTVQRALSVWPECCRSVTRLGESVNTTPESCQRRNPYFADSRQSGSNLILGLAGLVPTSLRGSVVSNAISVTPGILVSSFSLFGIRIVAMTFHPLDANNLAAARPRPEELPVIKIASCLSLFMCALLLRRQRSNALSLLPRINVDPPVQSKWRRIFFFQVAFRF